MDARPEFAALKFEARGGVTVVLPQPPGLRLHPVRKHEFLFAKEKAGDRSVIKLSGNRSASVTEMEDSIGTVSWLMFAYPTTLTHTPLNKNENAD